MDIGTIAVHIHSWGLFWWNSIFMSLGKKGWIILIVILEAGVCSVASDTWRCLRCRWINEWKATVRHTVGVHLPCLFYLAMQ